jgi:hypothetical protein
MRFLWSVGLTLLLSAATPGVMLADEAPHPRVHKRPHHAKSAPKPADTTSSALLPETPAPAAAPDPAPPQDDDCPSNDCRGMNSAGFMGGNKPF